MLPLLQYVPLPTTVDPLFFKQLADLKLKGGLEEKEVDFEGKRAALGRCRLDRSRALSRCAGQVSSTMRRARLQPRVCRATASLFATWTPG
eukprot:scaffold50_cov420-Prasinococcus_capsulatus_cf.AAC.46